MTPAKTVGLITKLREFFGANPGEELTPADAREKFGATANNLRTSLLFLCARDELEVVIRKKETP